MGLIGANQTGATPQLAPSSETVRTRDPRCGGGNSTSLDSSIRSQERNRTTRATFAE
jgi:hypothetical protein